jgi:hypothetical protein
VGRESAGVRFCDKATRGDGGLPAEQSKTFTLARGSGSCYGWVEMAM